MKKKVNGNGRDNLPFLLEFRNYNKEKQVMTLREYRNNKIKEDITFYKQEIENLEIKIRRAERLLSFYREELRNLEEWEEEDNE